ncbi:bifunctional 5,10-methylenetetrahydrofolate dehydrogenase/5,10-methenyltetrahydrofolate cyclohydrolase [Clostridium disporicum]|uniref:bifunctional 5,10-methylenetetrahydrofolate dehydrogenase/5,10-methenyltetrahydrofolate cyclohydrolase n=1 Tax=Clostridium disporicum TaxID=84024 RepID=UPI0034A4C2AD
MMNIFLYGNEVKDKWLEEIKEEMANKNITPLLVIVQVGDNKDSNRYINNKIKSAEKIKMATKLIKLDETIRQEELISIIHELNEDKSVNGIIVQLPLPKHIDELEVNKAISPIKDVDGFTDVNVGRTLLGLDSFVSCTPLGIMNIFDYYNIDLVGKDVVIIGRSNIVGKPMSSLLINKGATITVCNSKTKNVKDKTKSADIVIVATGQTKFFNSDYFSDGQVLIDVGVNFDEHGKQCGDIDTETVMTNLNSIKLSPSPKGCGQTTVSALLYNTLKAFKLQNGLS